MTDDELRAVAVLARRAEKHYGSPQDVEWAIDRHLPDGENVVMLQSRPETVWSQKARKPVPKGGGDYMSSIVSTLVSPLHQERSRDRRRTIQLGETNEMASNRFPSPFEIEGPDGVDGWEDLYPYSVSFGDARRDYEDSRFWFWDSMHWGQALTPWDSTFMEMALAALSQMNSRHYRIPPADGVDFRVLYGYAFLSPVGVDPEKIEDRVPQFMERAGHYFQNWDALYDSWLGKVKATIDELSAIDFSPLPEMEELPIITDGVGLGSGYQASA